MLSKATSETTNCHIFPIKQSKKQYFTKQNKTKEIKPPNFKANFF